MNAVTRITGLAAGTLAGVALSLGIAASEIQTTVPTAAAYPQADYRPGTDLEPYCQWSTESRHRVLVIGKKISKASVKVRGGNTYTAKPVTRRTPQRYTLVWVKVPSRYQEDDIRKVSAKIKGKYRTCEPS